MNWKEDSKELQKLSQYLDGSLSEKERLQLKERLQVNPELRKELEQLSRTRLMLKSLPARRAPRNFYVTPEMAGKKVYPSIAPIFRLATALATFLFIVVVAGNVFWNSSQQAASASNVPVLISAHKGAQNSQAYLITWATPTSEDLMMGAQTRGYGGGGAVASGTSEGEGSATEIATPSSSPVEASGAMTATPSLGGGNSFLPSTVENTPVPTESALSAVQSNGYPATQANLDNQSGPILGINPGGSESGTDNSETPLPATSRFTSADFHVAEGVLAFLIVFGSVATFFFYRKGN